MAENRKKFSREECLEMLKKSNFKCAHCGKTLDEETMTVEHMFPLSKGGDNSEFNTVALCQKCNYDKSNFTYEVDRWYKYILPEYRKEYKKHFTILRCKLSKHDCLNEIDQRIYEIHPIENFKMVYHASFRNKKKAKELFHMTSIKLKLEKGYDGDAESILDFLNKCKSKYNRNMGVYTNEYIIRDHMRKGRTFILRNNLDEMFGVFMFVKTEYVEEIQDCIQIMNISEVAGMSIDYVMTLATVNRKAEECYSEILSDFFLNHVSKKSLPIFFSILGESDFADTKFDYGSIPTTLWGTEGKLQFLPIKSLRECIQSFFKTSVERGYNTQEEVDKVVDATLSSDGVFEYEDYYRFLWEGLGGGISLKENKDNGKNI